VVGFLGWQSTGAHNLVLEVCQGWHGGTAVERDYPECAAIMPTKQPLCAACQAKASGQRGAWPRRLTLSPERWTGLHCLQLVPMRHVVLCHAA
jgi:hypothetical protein